MLVQPILRTHFPFPCMPRFIKQRGESEGGDRSGSDRGGPFTKASKFVYALVKGRNMTAESAAESAADL